MRVADHLLFLLLTELVRGVVACDEAWQAHDEGRAVAPSRTVRLHRTAVQFDEVFHDTEAEAEAAVLPRRSGIRLTEAIEDVR